MSNQPSSHEKASASGVLWRLLQRGFFPVSLLMGLCAVTFFLSHVAPGDPARIILGPNAHQDSVTALRTEMGLDKPLMVQFGRFLGETFTGQWRASWISRQPVLRDIGDHLRPTLFLGFFASLYSILAALVLNAVAFVCPRLGNPFISLMRLGISVPSFVVSVAVVLATTGYQSKIMDAFALKGDAALIYVIPALAVALYPACVMTALLRDRFSDIYASPFFRAGRAAGYSLTDLFVRVLIPNSWSTLLAAWINQISLLVFSTIIVEYVFSFRGLGSLLIRSIQGKDLPMLSGIILVNGFFFLAVRTLGNLSTRSTLVGGAGPEIRPEHLQSI